MSTLILKIDVGELNKRIGGWLADLRLLAPNTLTFEEAAKSIGLSAHELSEIELGLRSIACDDLYSLATFYGATDAAIETLMSRVTESLCFSDHPQPTL